MHGWRVMQLRFKRFKCNETHAGENALNVRPAFACISLCGYIRILEGKRGWGLVVVGGGDCSEGREEGRGGYRY